MAVLQAAWMFYLHNSAVVINALGLFYVLSGAWLLLATQIRSSRRSSQLATSPAGSVDELNQASLRINRLFNHVGAICLGAGLLLSLISTQL